ncbi:hypothetical protein F4780DRAFT_313831 [Xylariomycetidae sp. FL0641]|nr:hypothetical protein F4780DRAFT_313831 [Xylariomycetidae sp. FL0641]
MAPITEFITIHQQTDTDRKRIDDVERTLMQSPGCLRIRTSEEDEDKSVVHFFVDWEAVEDAFGKERLHHRFSDSFAPAELGSPLQTALTPFPPVALDGSKSKVAQVARLYFPSDESFTPGLMQKISRGFEDFVEALRRVSPEGFSGETAMGWALETMEFKARECRGFVLVIGWDNVEAHLRFKETEGFAEIVPLINDLEGLKGSEVYHVSNRTMDVSKATAAIGNGAHIS